MSDDVHTVIPFAPPPQRAGQRQGNGAGRSAGGNGGGPVWGGGDGEGGAGGERPRRGKPRLRKLRFLSIVIGLVALALVSTVFGVMMSVASDLPQLENRQQYRAQANSILYDDQGHEIGVLTPPNNVVLVENINDISRPMRQAIVAVEDKRFWSNPGIDIRGIARAVVADATGGGGVQGASTIEEQFVKNALSEQGNRTIFEKIREAALAFQLAHHWKKQRILTEYLNTIYFGNGAYGIESAARVYFGKQLGFDPASPGAAPGTCGDRPLLPPCASKLAPYQAALLAGLVSNPYGYDPIVNSHDSKARRDLVLKDMLQQRYLSLPEYQNSVAQPLPTAGQILQPSEPPVAPYFVSWLRPQIIRALSPNRNIATYRAYYGGLRIHTTIDLQLQQAAQQAVNAYLSGPGMPGASLVAIDNKTGEVRAMVGGPGYQTNPFNLATEGLRQPGSSFKPFTLATAFEHGISPFSVWTSAPITFVVPNSAGKEHFVVHNFGNVYSGALTLAQATTVSDNSVFARVGIQGLGPKGTTEVAATANKMGIRTPVSTNPSMILGGLKTGVSALDMAHAYETFATGGLRVFNLHIGDGGEGPIGIHSIECPGNCPAHLANIVNHPIYKRVLPQAIANEVAQTLTGVVQSGTATQANIPGVFVAGKTGTTQNYADAWFVGWTPQLTVAVWVGFPDKLVPMLTQWNGGPVEGGTYPAAIWHNFMVQALQILAAQAAAASGTKTSTTATTPLTPAPAPQYGGTTPGATAAPGTVTTPAATTPAPAVPAPTAPTAPATGGGTGTGHAPTGGGTGPGTGNGGGAGASGGGHTGGTGIPSG